MPEKRENVVHVRLNDDEKEALQVMAYREGLTVSSWIRAKIHQEAREWAIEMPDFDVTKEGVEE